MSSASGSDAGAFAEGELGCNAAQFSEGCLADSRGSEVFDALPTDSYLDDSSFVLPSLEAEVTGPQCEIPAFDVKSDTTLSFLKFLHACLKINMHSHVGLRDFVLKSLERDPRAVQPHCKMRDLWPCPPPVWKWTGCNKPSPRRRRLRRFWQLRNLVVQQIVCTLNWEALGHIKVPPPAARVGAPLSSDQLSMIERIEGMVSYFMRAGDFSASSLGRSADKLSRILHACEELPAQVQDEDLEFLATFVNSSFDPYSRTSKGDSTSSDSKTEDFVKGATTSVVKHVDIQIDTMAAKPVQADRIKWEHSPSFDPRPYLTDPIVKQAFEDPNCMRLPESLWLHRPVARVHCSRKEVLKLAEKWDSKSACRLFPADQVDHDEAVGIFAVHKDSDFDRLILNPVVINGKSSTFRRSSFENFS